PFAGAGRSRLAYELIEAALGSALYGRSSVVEDTGSGTRFTQRRPRRRRRCGLRGETPRGCFGTLPRCAHGRPLKHGLFFRPILAASTATCGRCPDWPSVCLSATGKVVTFTAEQEDVFLWLRHSPFDTG